MYKDLIQAAQILSEVCSGRNIDAAFNQFIKEDNNKNFVKDIVYGSVRDFYLNDFILNKFVKNDIKDQLIRYLLLNTIYQINHQSKTEFTVVNEAVKAAKKICKSEAYLNLENKAENIVNTIMSLNPFPISRISFRQKEVKIFHAELSNIVSIENQPGSISISEDLLVATADFYIKINSIQMSGGQMLTGKEFIKNYQLKPSEKFSNV